jgi:hypothetical protein
MKFLFTQNILQPQIYKNLFYRIIFSVFSLQSFQWLNSFFTLFQFELTKFLNVVKITFELFSFF